mmetsp:Transcript_39351/g.48726  ORF Transcript_39351/g.48726 Transcript_39351/m.48726 type:complete len:188 (-) Transcript_39351:51-614(-)
MADDSKVGPVGPVIIPELPGFWIDEAFNVVKVTMIKYTSKFIVEWLTNDRPTASGEYDAKKRSGSCTFPDDNTYTFKFEFIVFGADTSIIIAWSNKTKWNPFSPNISGIYVDGNNDEIRLDYSVDDNEIIIKYLTNMRPNGYGNFNAFPLSGYVRFIDDSKIVFNVDRKTKSLKWGNNTTWKLKQLL